MNFCYVLGSGSRWQDNEIRYSIRSVLKFHPDAIIHIFGEKPRWYDGLHTYVPDATPYAQLNQWKKLEAACRVYEEFVYMDDDFFLLEPFEPKHYKWGTLHEYQAGVDPRSAWGQVVVNTYKAMPDAERHLLHVPLPIISENFLKIGALYPQRYEPPSLVPRQIYCHHETAFEVAEIRDCKINRTLDLERIEGRPFFSTGDNVHRMQPLLERLYPTPSPYENILPVIVGNQQTVEESWLLK